MNYLYHPLGEWAKNLVDGTVSSLEAYPHSYAGHGWGKLDWNPGGGLGVYSMTDGTITTIAKMNDQAGERDRGYYVIVKTSGMKHPEPVYIRYLEMGGLSDELCSLTNGLVPSGKATHNNGTAEWTIHPNSTIKKGALIGYTNTFAGQSDLHIDFTKIDNFQGGAINFNDISATPAIDGYSLESIFSVNGGKIYQNGEIIGNSDGHVPNMYKGGASTIYTVYPVYSYCVQMQKPTYLEQTSSINYSSKYQDTGAAPTPEYGTKIFSDAYMGTYPKTLEQLNSNECQAIRILCFAANGELGSSQFGLAYGKLFRTWIMYSPEQHHYYPNQTKSLLEFSSMWNDYARPAWGLSSYSKTAKWNDLEFAQNLYNNIKYPDAFGITDQEALYISFSGPTQNAWSSTTPIQNFGPFACFVCRSHPEVGLGGDETYGGGCFLLYRTKSYTIGNLNPNI